MKKILLLLSITLFATLNLSAETIATGSTVADDNVTIPSKIAPDSAFYTDNASNNQAPTKDNSSKVINKKIDNATVKDSGDKATDNQTDNLTAKSIEGNDSTLLNEEIATEEGEIKYNKYVAINASYYMPSGGKEIFNPNFSLGFLFGYFFLDYLGIEVGVSSQIKSKVSKYDIKAYLSAKYQIFEINKFPVYIYGGAGVIYSSLDSTGQTSGSKSSFNFGAKAGLKITVAERYNLGVVAEYIGAKFYSKDFSAVTIGAEVGVMF